MPVERISAFSGTLPLGCLTQIRNANALRIADIRSTGNLYFAERVLVKISKNS